MTLLIFLRKLPTFGLRGWFFQVLTASDLKMIQIIIQNVSRRYLGSLQISAH